MSPRPLRRFSQHFLTDDDTLRRIAEAAVVGTGERVVEIGAGPGNLTRHLLARGARLWAIEIDVRFRPDLESLSEEYRNLRILQQDALRFDWGEAVRDLGGPVVAVGNVPYGITGRLLQALLAGGRGGNIARAILTVQLEVARRLTASRGSRDFGALTLRTEADAEARLLLRIPAGRFFPKPKVDSALVELVMREVACLRGVDRGVFDRVVGAAFSARRKTLRNALAGGLGIGGEAAAALLGRSGIDPARRPQTLSLEEAARLASAAA